MDWSPGFLLIILLPFLHTGRGASAPCQLRAAGGAGVCVCNATYCDALDAAPPPPGAFHHVASSRAGLRFRRSAGALSRAPPAALAPGAIQFAVDPNSTHQTMIGWGTSFTDSAGLNLLDLSPSAQELLLRSYFSQEGLDLNMARVPIGGSDFSTRNYTYDDVEDDVTLSKFNLTSEDLIYKIPLMLKANELRNNSMKFFAAAWSAPIWMKTNHKITGVGYLLEEFYQTWADYLIKFLKSYKSHGIDFWRISTGNEPNNVLLVSFNSMGWTAENQARFVAEHLGPTLEKNNFDTRIIVLDDQRSNMVYWMDIMMKNQKAATYFDGIGVHWYTDNYIPSSVLKNTHNKYPEKFILATEACDAFLPWDFPKVKLGSWKRGENYMKDILEDVNNRVSGWVDWNLALDLQGGPNWVGNFVDAAVIVNKSADEFYKQPMFYALGHFSKFVPEGSVHIGVEPQSLDGVTTAAFSRPDNKTVVVLYNSKSAEKDVTVQHPDKGYVSISVAASSFNTVLF